MDSIIRQGIDSQNLKNVELLLQTWKSLVVQINDLIAKSSLIKYRCCIEMLKHQ